MFSQTALEPDSLTDRYELGGFNQFGIRSSNVLNRLPPSETLLRLTYFVPLEATKGIQNAQNLRSCRANRLPTQQPTHPLGAWK